MAWLEQVIQIRLEGYFKEASSASTILPPPPVYQRGAHAYGDLILRLELGLDERVCIALALAPAVEPQMLDVFLHRPAERERLTEFGGAKGVAHQGFLPTGETALFLLAGKDLAHRFRLLPLLDPDHVLYRQGILNFQRPAENDPPQCGSLLIAPAFLRLMITGEAAKPEFSASFPARRITTPLTWEDLILEPAVMEQVQDIRAWAQHGEKLHEWGLGRGTAPGCRVLFHGPRGTGKTLAACLLGQALGREVYRVDLSQVVSKYIGETEKNLARVFDQAEDKDWILFFDEADAIFGKRSEVKDSHDRYANLEISYLLQRLEDSPGLVILATNVRTNLDAAWARRLQTIVLFTPPDLTQRLRLWQRILPPLLDLEPWLRVEDLARDHELTGGQIVNVVRHAALKAAERGGRTLHAEDIRRGVTRELEKMAMIG